MDSQAKPSKETLQQWHADPANWKWGVFYYNKEDRRILPPKRVAWMGWTVNFANPYSYLGFLAFFILLLLITLYALK